MDLPNNEIGISDILAWRDCPRRMSFSMRRWTDRGEPPEATNESNAYGSAIHMVFDLIEREGLTDSEAIQRAFDRYGGHLWPHDLLRMRRDVDTYHERDPSGVRLIGSEINVRVPLFKWGNGEQIWFRGQIDRLYERVNSPGRFIHRDYKSSKWPKTQEEIDEDLQMWSYNWLIHEFWPECEDLEQVYDQLLEGELRPPKRNDQHRRQIRDWLTRQVMAILNDDSWQDDDLLAPMFNDWCPYCPIKESCSVRQELSVYARDRVDALSGLEDADKVDLARIEEYVGDLEDVATARKLLESYEKKIKALIKELPEADREKLGYRTSQRRNAVWSADALAFIHELLGDEFFNLATLPKGRVESYLAGDPRLEQIMGLSRKEPGPVFVVKAGRKMPSKTT
jgi:hypothetical protein